jgi:hypothetical protein
MPWQPSATRYENVADAAGQWSGDLAEAQAASLTALRMAQGPCTGTGNSGSERESVGIHS